MWKGFDLLLEDLRGSMLLARRAMSRGGPRYPSDRERRLISTTHTEGIRRELANRSEATLEHEERQQLAYWRLWRSIRHAAGDAIPPEILDASVAEHVTLALTVVGDYDDAREEPGAFSDRLYRPVSDLPYPRAAIHRCCEFLIAIADGDPGSYDGDHELLAKERDGLGLALFSLDYFLDLPANEIPRRKLENLAFVKHEYFAGSTTLAKPRQGDIVLRSGSSVSDYVSEVIGVCDDDEWMIMTRSGVSMQVVRSAELGKWDEIEAIAPAEASWLTLTPSAGSPSLDVLAAGAPGMD